VGNGNIDVGNETPPRIDQSNPSRKDRPRICIAMAQQCGDGGRINQSAPQKFVQLVGCREPKARAMPWVRPRPAPIKP
jgi:hypothetical protein